MKKKNQSFRDTTKKKKKKKNYTSQIIQTKINQYMRLAHIPSIDHPIKSSTKRFICQIISEN